MRDYYVEAERIVTNLAERALECDHGDRLVFCRADLEAEVASLLRGVEIARGGE